MPISLPLIKAKREFWTEFSRQLSPAARRIVIQGRQLGILRVARELWDKQDGKCADCGRATPFEEMTKRGFSFNLICEKCYKKRPPVFIIIDDIDEEQEQCQKTQ